MKTRLYTTLGGLVAVLAATSGLFAGGENPKEAVYPAGSLIGMDVLNKQAQHLGEIEDFVVNVNDGRILYAAMRHGSTLGFGGKLFALPTSDLYLAKNGNNFLMDRMPTDFNNAKGFDENAWPAHGDERWGKVTEKQADASHEHLARVSKMQGMQVRNKEGEDLGKSYDLGINWYSPRVRYIAVTRGSTLGVGGKLVAVPFGAFTLQSQKLNPNRRDLVLAVSKETFDRAKTFENNNWPAQADPGFIPVAK